MSAGDEFQIRLKCTECRAYRDFERDGESVVRCADCGKRHSTDSLYAIEPGEEAAFED